MIPKTIHYCWFGDNQLDKMAKRCIKSWKKYCPDYEIIEWNESNFDINVNQYVKEAYQAKKWAFVSDYARFYILYKYGGVYLDTDVEIIKPLNGILSRGPIMGCEEDGKDKKSLSSDNDDYSIRVAPGLIIAAEPCMKIIKTILEDYEHDCFINKDKSYNLRTVVERTTSILSKNGLEDKNTIQHIAGFYIYPKEYFCPKDFYTEKIVKTKNTVCIHHFNASWHGEKEKQYMKIRRKNLRKEQRRNYIKYMPNRVLIKLLGNDKYNKLKHFLRSKQ